MLEIRRLRKSRGWNQTELAFYASLAPSVISQVENGKRDPSASTLRKLAKALEVEVGDLFPKVEPSLPFEEAPFPFDATAVAREAVEEAGAETEEDVFRVIDAAYSRALEGWSREDLQAMYERANQAALRELSGPQRGTWEELERKQREWRESDSYRRYREASAERYAISAALAALDRAEASDLVPA